jgi:hypothetical protein
MLVRLGSFIFIFLKSGLYKKRGREKKKKNVFGAARSRKFDRKQENQIPSQSV